MPKKATWSTTPTWKTSAPTRTRPRRAQLAAVTEATLLGWRQPPQDGHVLQRRRIDERLEGEAVVEVAGRAVHGGHRSDGDAGWVRGRPSSRGPARVSPFALVDGARPGEELEPERAVTALTGHD